MRSFIFFTVATSATLGLAVAAAQTREPHPSAPAAHSTANLDSTTQVLARVLDARLTVWRTPRGVPVHVSHCRSARGGCRARIVVFARWIAEEAKAHSIDPFVLAAVAMRESGLDPMVRGAAGELGIIQLHPHGVGRSLPFIRSAQYRRACRGRAGACQHEVLAVGAGLIARSITMCGSLAAGLGAYNSGVCGKTDYATRVLKERDRLLGLARLTAPQHHDADGA